MPNVVSSCSQTTQENGTKRMADWFFKENMSSTFTYNENRFEPLLFSNTLWHYSILIWYVNAIMERHVLSFQYNMSCIFSTLNDYWLFILFVYLLIWIIFDSKILLELEFGFCFHLLYQMMYFDLYTDAYILFSYRRFFSIMILVIPFVLMSILIISLIIRLQFHSFHI